MAKDGSYNASSGGSPFMSDEKSTTITIPQGDKMETFNESGTELPATDGEILENTNATALNTANDSSDVSGEIEPVIHDSDSQEIFTRELLTQGESGHNLLRQINSENFLDDTGTFTAETVKRSLEHGLSTAEIEAHQQAINQQVMVARDKMFTDANITPAFGKVILEFAQSHFDSREREILKRETLENPAKSMQTLEKYYMDFYSGKEKR